MCVNVTPMVEWSTMRRRSLMFDAAEQTDKVAIA